MSDPARGAPLKGLRVAVTRAASQASDLSDRLSARGAAVIELPAIEIEPLSTGPLDDALGQLASYDWVVLTSSNGVAAFVDRLAALGLSAWREDAPRVAAVGRTTAARLQAAGIPVDLVPQQAVAEALLAALIASGIAGRRVLLPVAEGARDVLPDGLRRAGAQVEVVHAYRTIQPPAADAIVAEIRSGGVDVLTFASPSAVRNTAEIVGLPLPEHTAIACIGPVTSAAAVGLGLRVDVEAGEHSIAGLVEAIVAWAASRSDVKERPDDSG